MHSIVSTRESTLRLARVLVEETSQENMIGAKVRIPDGATTSRDKSYDETGSCIVTRQIDKDLYHPRTGIVLTLCWVS